MTEEMRPHFDRFRGALEGLRPGSRPGKVAAAEALAQGWELAEVYSGDLDSMLLGLGHFRAAVEHDPTLVEAYAGIGECLMASGYWQSDLHLKDAVEEGIRWVERGLAMEPADYRCMFAKAKLLWAAGRTEEASALAHELVKAHPGRPGGYHVLMQCLARQRKFAEAIARGREALARTAPGTRLRLFHHRKLASRIGESGDRDEGAREYERLLAAFPDDPWSLHNASMVFYAREEYDRALELSDRALAQGEFEPARSMNSRIKEKIRKRDRPGALRRLFRR